MYDFLLLNLIVFVYAWYAAVLPKKVVEFCPVDIMSNGY